MVLRGRAFFYEHGTPVVNEVGKQLFPSIWKQLEVHHHGILDLSLSLSHNLSLSLSLSLSINQDPVRTPRGVEYSEV